MPEVLLGPTSRPDESRQSGDRRCCELRDLGRMGYAAAFEVQRDLVEQRKRGEISDVLLIVEHPHVVTMGRNGHSENLLASPELLERAGIEFHHSDRGGDVTYHGPGQLVGYPILQLQEHRADLHWYLRQLEATLIAALDPLGITAERREGLTGVWAAGRKIASIGIHVKQWVTFHGFALNVSTDLRGFDLIVPCGIHGVTMTSVAAELKRDDAAALWAETSAKVLDAFERAFGYAQTEPVDALALSVALPQVSQR